jgi:hypothetical protein
MSKLLERLKTNSRIKECEILANSEFFKDVELTSTPVPMINVALSGELDGGLASGLTILAGPSKHFKTSYALLIAAAYLDKHPDAVLMFYDSEFGSPQSYFESFGIDLNRVLHIPVKNVEELKFDMVHQLEAITKKDKVIIITDSLGNLASKKELDDAKDAKSITDMTRAKSLKALFRMVTPYFTMKDVPCLCVNHTYQEMGLFPKAVVSGGTGLYYSASNIWIVGRQQDKVGTEIQGYHFIINVEKSRFVKEKSKIPISVSWEGGIYKYSGILDLALEGGFITKTGHFIQLINIETGEPLEKKVRPKAIPDAYWEEFIQHEPFKKFIKDKFALGQRQMIASTIINEDETYDDEE